MLKLTASEAAALDCCRANLGLVEPHPDYVDGGKFAVEPVNNPSRGKCYIASAALSEYLGGPKGGYHLVKATNHLGEHYWVANDKGVILDPTREQFDLIGERPPYRFGRRVGRRNNLTKHLPILEAMRATLEPEEKSPVVDLFGRPLVVARGQALTDEQISKLNDAWRSLIGDWASRPEDMIQCFFPRGALAVYFVRAMLYGEEIPRTATMAYTWDRYNVAGSSMPFSGMLPAAAVDDERGRKVLRGVRFALNDEVSFHKLIAGNLPVLGYRMPFDFPIGLARELIDKYCPSGGAVLDPCHGWGGRMVGFLLSRAAYYVGIDPAPHSYKLREMFDDLVGYADAPKRIKLINKPFEDVSLSEARYDFALTSPPYYNTEKYLGDESSWRRYRTLDEWIDGFYRPLIVGVADALKSGANFALQVTPKFKMVEIAREIGAEVGLVYDRAFDTNMKRYNSASADKAGSTDLFEVVAIFRRE